MLTFLFICPVNTFTPTLPLNPPPPPPPETHYEYLIDMNVFANNFNFEKTVALLAPETQVKYKVHFCF